MDIPSGPMALEAFEFLMAALVASAVKDTGFSSEKRVEVLVILLVVLLVV